MRSHHARFTRATRLGCAAQTVYCSELEPQAALDHATPIIHSAGRYSEESSRIAAESIGAFPLHGTVRFGTARYGTVQLSSGRFAFSNRSLVPL